jgi:hypothetical protein
MIARTMRRPALFQMAVTMKLFAPRFRTRRVDRRTDGDVIGNARPLPRGLGTHRHLLMLVAIPIVQGAAAQDARVASVDERHQADRLLTVDCLLPGQVRQLGTSMTYLTPRRPIRTSAADCEVRGGEYVAYDRANYTTALRVWQPTADQGDKEAQTNIGEIYERGVGGPPDYEKAAIWYRKAADQGYARALINLGFLYEQGRGVPKDPAMALQLYRRAAGLTGTVNLESAPSGSQEEVDSLRKELDRTRQELEKARRELDQERIKTSAEIERLTQKKIAAAAAGNADESRRLEAQLKDRETELDKRRQQVAKFEQSAEENRARLARLEGESASMRQELERARSQLAQSQREIEEKRTAAARAERDLESAHRELALQKQPGSTVEPSRIRTLETELAKRDQELGRQKQDLARLEKDNASFKDKVSRLDRVEGESAALRQELDQAKQRLAQSQREIKDRQNAAEVQDRELEATRLELARQQHGPTVDPARVRALEAELAKRNEERDRQKQALARLEGDLSGYKEKVARLEAAPASQLSRVDVAPPSIQLLDPSVVVTRDTAAVAVRAGLTSRPVVGRVSAPAGLVSFTANDVAQQVDKEGFFNSNVALGGGRTRVTLVAVDRQSKRAAIEFFLDQDSGVAKAGTPARTDAPGLNLGNYYALLIGNQKYQNLRALNSPEADVKDIGTLLRDRYGFNVTTLVNATRYQILTELNRYMETLTDRDSLLIYYAGHGEIEEASQVAFWLPVDADPKNDSNWISSDDLTRKIGPMRARHVLVVSDSCYSGVLTRSSISQAKQGATDEERNEWLKTVASKKSRSLLSSGGRAPVMDGGGGKHSVFAAVFIEALTVNEDVLDGKHLGEAVAMRVLKKSKDMKFGEGQLPDYRPIKFADNDGGEFLFPRPKAPVQRVSIQVPALDAVDRNDRVAAH